jgi:hypothetical protein
MIFARRSSAAGDINRPAIVGSGDQYPGAFSLPFMFSIARLVFGSSTT